MADNIDEIIKDWRDYDRESAFERLRDDLSRSIQITNESGIFPKQAGGQHTGRINSTQVLTCKSIGVRIEIGCHRSMHQNRELAITLFELILSELK